ncbi:alpha/beta hydrolase [Amycolatopsis antarctica]|uniref:Alpha/beta hydrolase n=1 Tax=Amycolatopsis antarctica TaxID=1854586 RepID=A0A263CVP3_9PSEU|nr:alpha/beta fold hydrolase [Amycolatopsis antarctica]OZM70210.1 alpha/beta hydrolase [Amycolatopsis antarctica]
MTPELLAADGIRLDARLHQGAEGRAAVVLAHGITGDLDELGHFPRLAARLGERGVTVLRFSYRGHGASGGTPRGVTIEGERLDLLAAARYALAVTSGPLFLVASSFGAVSTLLSLPLLGPRLRGLVLWNPVLDLRRTFLEPSLPRGRELYGGAAESFARRGFLRIRDGFDVDPALFEEFTRHDPLRALSGWRGPALIVHGDQDRHVPCAVARATADNRPDTVFHVVPGADHGFRPPGHARELIEVTADWLRSREQSVAGVR